MVDFIIREYSPDDLPALAQHFRESVPGWPPGEFSGWDFSPDAIRRMLFTRKHLAVWIAVTGDIIIGFMNYAAHYDEPGARYIPLLNAHPDYHGTGVGRELLRAGVNRAVADKAKRLDLHTWAANMKAVPLYKKTGFFWRPGTEVHMYNFLPTALRNPYVKRFLGDADWYTHMRQDLSVEEDNTIIDGCHIQRYAFEKDGKRLEVRIDPSTAGVIALIGDELEIRCDVPGDKHIAGFSYPVKWFIKNMGTKPVNIMLDCRGDESIEYALNKQLELKDEASFITRAKLNPSIKPPRKDWLGIPLACKVEVDGLALEFRPGLRAMPPFELEIAPWPIYLSPREEKRFTFNLKSNSSIPVAFQPQLDSEGVISLTSPSDFDVMSIAPEGCIGLHAAIRAGYKEGAGAVRIDGVVKTEGQEAEIEPLKAHARVIAGSIPAGISDHNSKRAYLANGSIAAKIDCEKGYIRLAHQATGRAILSIRGTAIGEPYSPEMGSTDHSLTIEESKTEAVATMRAASRDFPGMVLEEHIRLGTGREIEVWLTLINQSDNPFKGGVKLGLSHFTYLSMTVPFATGLVTGNVKTWLSGNANLPEEPSAYLEPWVAYEGENKMIGLVAEAFDRITFSSWNGSPQYEWKVANLAPSARVDLPRLTIIADAPNIDYIRAYALGDALRSASHPRYMMHLRRPLFASQAEICPFDFHFAREAPVKGAAEINFPDGKFYKASKENWNINNPIHMDIPLTGLKPGIVDVNYKMHGMQVQLSGTAPLVVVPPASDVKVTKAEEGGYQTFTVDNGAYKFKVSPNYCGTLWWWSESKDDASNLLLTPFPEMGRFTWMKPWYGGIGFGSWEIGYRFHHSGFSGAPDEVELCGYKWKGVRVDVSLLRSLSTLKMELCYLTLPGSPVLLMLMRLTETAGAERYLMAMGGAFVRPGGDAQKGTTGAIRLDDNHAFIGEATDGGEHNGRLWASVSDSVTQRTIGLIAPRGDMMLWDQCDEGRVLWWYQPTKTNPAYPTLFAAYYCLADKPEQIPLLAEELQYWEP